MAPILANISNTPLGLLCVVALIFWWLGIKYIREACPMKVGPPEKPSDCSVLNKLNSRNFSGNWEELN